MHSENFGILAFFLLNQTYKRCGLKRMKLGKFTFVNLPFKEDWKLANTTLNKIENGAII